MTALKSDTTTPATAAPALAGATAASASRTLRGELPAALVVLVVYGVIGLFAFWHNLPFDNAHLLSTAVNDTTDVGWFISWATFAFTHLHNPMFSLYMELPTGINLASNQSMPLVGVLSTPVTELFGPFATLNFTMWAALVSSGFSAYLVCLCLTTHRLPAFLAGLFYGFCPFLVAHSLVNQNFTFMPLLPPILYLAYRIVAERPARVRARGLWLGALSALQLYVNPEPLAELLFVVLLTAVAVLAWRARRLRVADLTTIASGLAWAVLAFVVIGAPFAYYYLLGPQHTSGPVVPLQYLAVFHTDLLGIIAPNHNQLIGPAAVIAKSSTYSGSINESGSYLGIPFVIALVAFAIAYRRARIVGFASIALFLGALFSLGPELWVNNRGTGIWMPARLLDGVPMLQSAETVRFFVVADTAAALVLAVGLDRTAGAFTAWWNRRRTGRPAVVHAVASALLGSLVLFPLVPRWPYPSYPIGIPNYFTTNEVDAIAPGSIVLTYPIAQSGAVNAMQWQIASDFRFKIVSGYGYVANDGGQILGNPPMNPGIFPGLENLEAGTTQSGSVPPLTVVTIAATRELLRSFHVDDFIMDPEGGYRVVEKYLTVALAERPRAEGGVLVWYGVAASVRQSLPAILRKDKTEGIVAAYPPPGDS